MIKWTERQDTAITARNTDLLVSASAGSGKTAVMIERITSMIVCREIGVDGLLVLTFTKESASDMRAKLRTRLEKELVAATKKEDKEYLTKQINALPISAIGTFHAFCNKLITTHFSIAGLDPSFKILDTVEAATLRSEVLDEIIAACYGECIDAIDVFCANRNTERLKEIIISIKEPFLNSRDDAEKWLETVAYAGYNEKLDDNPAMKQIIDHYRLAGEYYANKLKNFEISASSEGILKLAAIIGKDFETAARLAKVNSYASLHELALTVTFDALNKGIGKKERECSVYPAFKNVRDKFKKLVDRIVEHYSSTEEEMLEHQQNDQRIVSQVVKLVKEFEAAYSARKIAANKLDYSDLEMYACRVLCDPSVAELARDKYKFIFVDEYQDTNPMQEKILSLVGQQSTIFMVGDVKQSIYGFRGCEPTIFAGKVTDFETNLSGRVINLNENFRSNSAILEFVNCVFSKTMRNSISEIDYASTSEFTLGSPYPIPKGQEEQKAVEVVLIDTKKEKGDKKLITEIYDLTKDTEQSEEVKTLQAEAAIIAEKIKQFDKKQIWNAREEKFQQVRLSDIAILTRRKSDLNILYDVLKKHGIDATVQGEHDAAELFEIALVNNMLQATSNFYNDVAVVLLMQSFVFGFTPNELAKISCCLDNAPFYQKIQAYIEKESGELTDKLAEFIGFLEKYHDLGKRENVVEVALRFLTQFSVLTALSRTDSGAAMVQNIYSFLNKLRGQSYASTVSSYVFALERGSLDLKIATGASIGDCVQLMTMHGSKGLEWPIVILFNTGANFNNTDTRSFMVVDKQCGLCIYSTDTEEFIKHNSIARLGAVIGAERVLVAEELRLFYVALTRAKNHLIIIGSAVLEDLLPCCEDYDIACSKNFLQFLAPTVLRPVLECDFTRRTIHLDEIKIETFGTKDRVIAGKSDEQLVKKLNDVFSQQYEHKAASMQTLKNSVSSLTRNEEEVIDHKPFKLASCDRGGAEYGTLFHKMMQKANLEKTEANIEKNVKRCIEVVKPFIAGKKVFRELPFLQRIEKEGANILVQGVIDLLAIGQDGVVLIDYKTTNAEEGKLVEQYTPQLCMYAEAVKQALKTENIEVYIYSTVHGRLLSVAILAR